MTPATQESKQDLLSIISQSLDGEFDNFQQAWQENTEEDLHRLEIAEKHRHIHAVFKKMPTSDDQNVFYKVTYYENRDAAQILEEQIFHFKSNENGVVVSKQFALPANDDLTNLGTPLEELIWKEDGAEIKGIASDQSVHFILKDKLLIAHHQTGIFKNSVAAYRLIKCRFFAGWIEYALPEDPDKTYRMGDLIIHDQGGIIPLTFEDGTKGPYTVELTQLIFAKTLAIMKLGIYEEPFEEINYNSKAMSYTWTNPESRRIGINLRKVLTGWAYIEPGYFSSNHFDENKKK